MRGRLLFWLALILVVCILLSEVEAKKKKKGKKSKEHSHSHASKKSSRKSKESSESKEWDNRYQTQYRYRGGKGRGRGGQTNILRRPNGKRPGNGNGRNGRWTPNSRQWWWTPRPAMTSTTTTQSPRWENNRPWWQGQGNQWWNPDGNVKTGGWWEDNSDWDKWTDWEGDWDWNKWGDSEEWGDWDEWDWDDSSDSSDKSKKSKKHSHGSKGSGKHSHGSKGSGKHSHGSKESKHSKHSHGSKNSGESLESSGSSEWYEYIIIDGGDNSGGINPDWCLNWCYNFARQNFHLLFPNVGVLTYQKDTDYYVENYCNQFMDLHGYYCNTTDVVTDKTTTDPSVIVETTTKSYWRYQCRSSLDCEEDECCVSVGQNRTCMKFSGRNDKCSLAEDKVSYLGYEVYMGSCPCRYGYECLSKWDYISRKTPSLAGLLSDKQRALSRNRFCKPSKNMTMTTTTDRPVVTMLPPIERTTPEDVSNTTDGQVTETPVRSCSSHLDCDFFQCCINNDDDNPERGVCSNFGMSGDFCSPLANLTDNVMLDYCPCQAFLRCKSYKRGLTNNIYNRCG